MLLFSHQVMSNSSQHPWTIARQTPPSMGFPRQEYWSGLPFSSPGDLPDPGIEPRSPALQVDSLLSEPPEKLPYFFKAVPFASLYCFYLLHAMSSINGFHSLCLFTVSSLQNVHNGLSHWCRMIPHYALGSHISHRSRCSATWVFFKTV